MTVVLWVALAVAADPRPSPPIRVAGGWEASASLSGGVALAEGAASPLGEARHALVTAGTGRVQWDLRAGGVTELDGTGALRYGETLRAGLGGASGLGGVAGISLGGAPHWSEPQLMARWQRSTRTWTAELTAGAVGRTEADRLTAGAGSDLDLEWRFTPTFRTQAWSSVRTWAVGAVPALTAAGALAATGLPRSDLRLTLEVGARGASSHDSPEAAWSGLPAPGTADLWSLTRVLWAPRGPVGLVGEAGVMLPTAADASAQEWATLGVTASIGGFRSRPAPIPAPSFRLRAPGAATVAVAGSFNGWTAEPLQRSEADPDTWELRRALPPGSYEYVYLVDGQPRVPSEAARRVDDGFGGENGVIDVP